jgi:hypothetical protein
MSQNDLSSAVGARPYVSDLYVCIYSAFVVDANQTFPSYDFRSKRVEFIFVFVTCKLYAMCQKLQLCLRERLTVTTWPKVLLEC